MLLKSTPAFEDVTFFSFETRIREFDQAQETNFHQKESSEFVGKTRSGHIYFSLITGHIN